MVAYWTRNCFGNITFIIGLLALYSIVTEQSVSTTLNRVEKLSDARTVPHSNIRKIDDDGERIVGICDEESDCDDIKFDWPNHTNRPVLIVSSLSGKRFFVTNLVDGRDFDKSTSVNIEINLSDKKQAIMGWGGAFTDATCYHITQASPILAEKLISSYYGPKGLRYNFGRVPIGGSDFSLRPYTYDDTKDNVPDYELENWSLATEDLEYKIPVILRAKQLSDSKLKLFASPWSPPAWMKTNHDISRGHLIDSDAIYQSYASYLIKFFDAYESQGINFWGATVQNEPAQAEFPTYFFNSLQFNDHEQARFIGKFYGPALKASNRTKENFKLMVGDDNLGFVNYQVPKILQSEEAAQYVSGLAFHWYIDGSAVSYNRLNDLYNQIKDKIEFVLMTEACNGSEGPIYGGPKLGDWSRGETYARDIIEDLRRHTGGWIDWNMVLDMKGGPNWAKNFVDSPILLDANKKIFYKQPMYYALAHFTRLFPPECRILLPATSNPIKGLHYVACLVENTNHVVINILNLSDRPQVLHVSIKGTSIIHKPEVEPRSISSILIKL